MGFLGGGFFGSKIPLGSKVFGSWFFFLNLQSFSLVGFFHIGFSGFKFSSCRYFHSYIFQVSDNYIGVLRGFCSQVLKVSGSWDFSFLVLGFFGLRLFRP